MLIVEILDFTLHELLHFVRGRVVLGIGVMGSTPWAVDLATGILEAHPSHRHAERLLKLDNLVVRSDIEYDQ